MNRNDRVRQEWRRGDSYLGYLSQDVFDSLLMDHYLGERFLRAGALPKEIDRSSKFLVDPYPLTGRIHTPHYELLVPVNSAEPLQIWSKRTGKNFELRIPRIDQDFPVRVDRDGLIWTSDNCHTLSGYDLEGELQRTIEVFQEISDFIVSRDNTIYVCGHRLLAHYRIDGLPLPTDPQLTSLMNHYEGYPKLALDENQQLCVCTEFSLYCLGKSFPLQEAGSVYVAHLGISTSGSICVKTQTPHGAFARYFS